MQKITKVEWVQKRQNKTNGDFYLSEIVCEDGETYTVAHNSPALVGDEVMTFFDDVWNKPKAVYPKGT